MIKYECDYCGDPLCPELCPPARAARAKFLEERERLDEERKKMSSIDIRDKCEITTVVTREM